MSWERITLFSASIVLRPACAIKQFSLPISTTEIGSKGGWIDSPFLTDFGLTLKEGTNVLASCC